jgi:hypothetical protein
MKQNRQLTRMKESGHAIMKVNRSGERDGR